jgi:transcription antitermination factor NusG
MSSGHADRAWFAVRTRPNHERTVERGLSSQGWEAYLPVQCVRRRWSDRVKQLDSVLFPGYVFCRFSLGDRTRVLKSPGVRSIVGLGPDPAPIEESEISAVRALISSGRPISPWPYLRVGQTIVIHNGPLASLRGIIVRVKDSLRVVVSVEALSCSVAVELDADMLAVS